MIISDVLVRAGAKVTVASIEPTTTVRMSRGLKIEADCLFDEIQNKSFDLIVLPGVCAFF